MKLKQKSLMSVNLWKTIAINFELLGQRKTKESLRHFVSIEERVQNVLFRYFKLQILNAHLF